MNTILYLDNHYIQSLDDMKQVVEKAEGNPQSLLFQEIRAAFHNKSIEGWLNEGTDTEKRVAAKVGEISRKLADDKLLEQLNDLLADKKIKVEKPPYTKFAKIKSYQVKIGDREENISNDGNIFMCDFSGRTSLKIDIEIFEQANYEYEVMFIMRNEDNSLLSRLKKTLNLKKKDKNNTITFDASIKDTIKSCNVVVYLDGVETQRFTFMRKPIPQFVNDCSAKQKNIIQKLIDSMVLVKGKKGSFTIFDGYSHTATLTDYYISPRITQKEYHSIMSDSYYGYSGSAEMYMTNIRDFVNKLNDITSLHFDIPSEAQWENAAVLKCIKYGIVSEWCADSRNNSSVNSLPINPVCKGHDNMFVLKGFERNNPQARFFRKGHMNLYSFRLVITLNK